MRFPLPCLTSIASFIFATLLVLMGIPFIEAPPFRQAAEVKVLSMKIQCEDFCLEGRQVLLLLLLLLLPCIGM
jgi:hypothetical protein